MKTNYEEKLQALKEQKEYYNVLKSENEDIAQMDFWNYLIDECKSCAPTYYAICEPESELSVEDQIAELKSLFEAKI